MLYNNLLKFWAMLFKNRHSVVTWPLFWSRDCYWPGFSMAQKFCFHLQADYQSTLFYAIKIESATKRELEELKRTREWMLAIICPVGVSQAFREYCDRENHRLQDRLAWAEREVKVRAARLMQWEFFTSTPRSFQDHQTLPKRSIHLEKLGPCLFSWLSFRAVQEAAHFGHCSHNSCTAVHQRDDFLVTCTQVKKQQIQLYYCHHEEVQFRRKYPSFNTAVLYCKKDSALNWKETTAFGGRKALF